MKQITQNYKTGELKIEEVPAPMLKKGGVLVRICYSLISAGTERSTLEISKKSLVGKARARPDLVKQVIATSKKIGLKNTYSLVKNRLNTTVPLGYSLSGIVESVAEDVKGISAGDRVACAGVGYANHAEKVFLPQNLVASVPQEVQEEEAAFTTVGSIALHGIRQAGLGVGDAVGVIGLGLVGQITVAVLKAQGCRVMGIDLSRDSVELARKMGADAAVLRDDSVLGEKVKEITNAIGLDAVIITAGTNSNDPFELASEVLRDRGTLVVVGGIRMEIVKSVSSLFYQKEIDIRFSRSYGPGRYDPDYEEKGQDYPVGYVRWTEKRNMECFLDLLPSGRINLEPLITHTFAFEDAHQAYEVIQGKTGEPFCGVLLKYAEGAGADEKRINIKAGAAPVKGNIGIGMIGAGNFAQANLLPFLKAAPKAELKGICTAKGLTARNVAEKFGFAYCAGDTEEILKDEENQVIFIATRHDSHAEYVIKALEAGKHVFVEKPLCIDEDQLEEIRGRRADVAPVEHPGRGPGSTGQGGQRSEVGCPVLMVGYNRRFAPLSVKLKEFLGDVSGKAITVIYRVNAGHIPEDNWYQDPSQRGRFIGEGCHFIDFGQFLTDSMPVRVSTAGIPSETRPLILTDDLVVNCRMKNGSVVTVIYNASGDEAMPKERIEVFGGNSSAVLDDFKVLTLFRDGKKQKVKGMGQDKGYRQEIEAFLKLIEEGGEPLISFESLVATSRATFAAMESLRLQKVVEI